MNKRKKSKRKRGTRKSHRKGKPSGNVSTFSKDPHKQKEKGFTPPRRKQVNTMNIGKLNLRLRENRIDAPKEDNTWIVNPTEIGIEKILGAGSVDLPIKLVLPEKVEITEKARSKIKEAGGTITKPEE